MENTKMNRGMKITVILLVLNLLISSGLIGCYIYEKSRNTEVCICTKSDENTVYYKYVLYVGLNDKDTYSQKISTEEATEIVNNICLKYTDGYTVSEAKGGWTDETGVVTRENTLVYSFYDISEVQITSIMDEILVELNQNSVLLETQNTYYTYYSGK